LTLSVPGTEAIVWLDSAAPWVQEAIHAGLLTPTQRHPDYQVSDLEDWVKNENKVHWRTLNPTVYSEFPQVHSPIFSDDDWEVLRYPENPSDISCLDSSHLD
jgi:hypothetical protein